MENEKLNNLKNLNNSNNFYLVEKLLYKLICDLRERFEESLSILLLFTIG